MRVAAWALLWRVVVSATASIVAALVPAFDTSVRVDAAAVLSPYGTPLSAESALVLWWVRPLASWDGMFMSGIADFGYRFEQYFAFFPLYPLLSRAVGSLLLRPVVQGWACVLEWCGFSAAAEFAGSIEAPALRAVGLLFVSHASFVLAAAAMYLLSYRVLGSAQSAHTAAMLFIVSPASIFFSAAMTESLFAALSLCGMLLFELALDVRGMASANDAPRVLRSAGLSVAAIASWTLATGVRSNGAVSAGFVVFGALSWLASAAGQLLPSCRAELDTPDGFEERDGAGGRARYSSVQLLRGCGVGASAWSFGAVGIVVGSVILVFAGVASIVFPLAAFQDFGHAILCGSSALLLDVNPVHSVHSHAASPVRQLALDTLAAAFDLNATILALPPATQQLPQRPWCGPHRGADSVAQLDFWTTGLYGFVQKHYWGIGFLSFWDLRQLPNFALAAPMLLLVAWTVREYVWPRGTTSVHPKPLAPVRSPAVVLSALARIALVPIVPFFALAGVTSMPDVMFRARRNLAPIDTWNAAMTPRALPYVAHAAFLAVFALCLMHVQVATRFLAAASPVPAWGLAFLWHRGRTARSLILTIALAYTVLGTVLFPTFYPWV